MRSNARALDQRSTLDRLIAWSPVLLLGAFVALTYWLNSQVRIGSPAFNGSTRHDPDVFVDDFRAVNLDVEGRVRQSLTARRAQHYPDDDTTRLDAPSIVFTEPGEPALNVTADHGSITGDRENAYFNGNVRAVRAAIAGTKDGPVVFESEYLHVLPKLDRIESDKPVTITDPRGIIRATGVVYENKGRTIRFSSNVNGRFLPEK